MNITPVMTTIPERQEIRSETLSQLCDAGIPSVNIIEQSDATRGGDALRRTQRKALTCGLRTSSPILYLEDDLRVSREFLKAIVHAHESDFEVVTFYATNKSFYTAPVRRAILNGEAYEPGVYRLTNQRGWFGTQCVLLSQSAAQKIKEKWEGKMYLDDYLSSKGPEMGVYAPNPVQHAGAELGSTWSPYGKPHKSISFEHDR